MVCGYLGFEGMTERFFKKERETNSDNPERPRFTQTPLKNKCPESTCEEWESRKG